MIDFYRKSFLSQLGKNAGNMTTLDFLRDISDKYPIALSKSKELKNKGIEKNPEGGELYL